MENQIVQEWTKKLIKSFFTIRQKIKLDLEMLVFGQFKSILRQCLTFGTLLAKINTFCLVMQINGQSRAFWMAVCLFKEMVVFLIVTWHCSSELDTALYNTTCILLFA